MTEHQLHYHCNQQVKHGLPVGCGERNCCIMSAVGFDWIGALWSETAVSGRQALHLVELFNTFFLLNLISWKTDALQKSLGDICLQGNV